jgi:ribosomal protein S18 acetylase RimI-like enzyme
MGVCLNPFSLIFRQQKVGSAVIARVTVRRFLKGGDESALVELMNAEYREYASWWRGTTVEEILELEKNPSFNAAERLIAEVGGKPVGLIHARVEKADEEKRGFIRDFCVLPSFRGIGVEEKLMEAAVTEFREHGVKQVRAWTGVGRTDRIEFLVQSGFRFSHRTIDMRIGLEKVPSNIGENMEVTIRPVEIEEAKEVETLNWLANTCFKDDPLYVPETVEETRRAHVDKSLYQWQKFFFAVADDRDVGYVGLAIDEKYNVEHDVKTGFVTWIGVLPGYRRRGIGTRLLLHSFSVLKAMGMTSASLDTEDSNPTRAITLYEKVGFRVLQEYVTYAKDVAPLP